ncbi:MAG TPA: FkbM family methyltransferase [Bacteroidia bacterium]|nr:FkbM family methyltransferase [Bacteroidia bacterium]
MNGLKRFVKSFFRNQWCEAVIIFFSSVPVLRRFFFLLRPRHSDYAPGTLRRAKRNNIHYELDISDWVEWNIYFCNRVEPREKIYALALPGDTVIDVGVNIGETLLNLATQVGEKGKAIGFEPAPGVFAKCRKNIELNPALKNISLHPFALGKEERELFIEERDERNKGMNSLSASAHGEKVKVTTLDSFLQRESFSRIDLIKLDVEGFEMNVLHGAEQTILRFHPKLFIELDDDLLKLQQSSAAGLVKWLIQKGYKIYNAENDSVVSAEQSLENCHFDITCE